MLILIKRSDRNSTAIIIWGNVVRAKTIRKCEIHLCIVILGEVPKGKVQAGLFKTPLSLMVLKKRVTSSNGLDHSL